MKKTEVTKEDVLKALRKFNHEFVGARELARKMHVRDWSVVEIHLYNLSAAKKIRKITDSWSFAAK